MEFRRSYARKLAICVATIGLTITPVLVQALGLGGIKLNSALSEILNAEIELFSATPSEIDGLKIKLASREAFLRAGIDRTTLLNSLRFKIKRHSSGQYYIKVTSRRPIREPFLNFLLEVNWKSGRMLREYTMLLDPPGRIQHQPTFVETPKTVAPAPVKKTTEATPEASPFVAPEPVPVPVAKKADADEAYIADKELFPKRSIEETAAPEETKAASEPVAKAPEQKPEPVIPESVVSEQPAAAEAVKNEPESDSGKVREELSDSGEIIDSSRQDKPQGEQQQAFADNEELFPRIPLTEYDESKSIQYDEEPVSGEAVAQAEVAQQSQMEAGNLDYGITKKSDNLWSIADRMRHDDSVSVYQVMMALLRSNPDAFVKGNVHRLKVGQVLRIDDPGLITAMSREQAIQEYQTQTLAWEDYRQQVAAAATQQPLITSDVDTTQADFVATAPSGELSISAPQGDDLSAANAGQGSTDKEVSRLQQELAQISGQAKLERGKNTVLNERLRALESELEQMQRTLVVRNDELAALQHQASQQTQVETPAPVEEPPAPVTEPEQAETIQQAPEATTEQPAPDETETPPETAVPAPAPVVPAPVTEPEPVQPPPQPGFFENLSGILSGIIAGGGLLLYIGAPLALVVLVVAIIMIRRKRSGQENFQESILSGAAPTDTETALSQSTEGGTPSETSSFLSDFAISGVGAIQTEDSEVDPLTEADVFMAYGRYEAAEERLQEAISSDPDRHELKVKLLELFNTTKNATAFESTAESLYADLGDNAAADSNWQKVIALGKQIVPDNPLFSGVPTVTTDAIDEGINLSDVSMSESQVMDIGLETGVFSTDELAPEDVVDISASDMSDLDFNLDADADEQVNAQEDTQDKIVAPDSDVQNDAGGLDFNLDTESDEESTGMDFSLDTDDGSSDEETMSMTLDAAQVSQLASVSIDTEPTSDMDTEGFDPDTASMQLDTGSLDLNLDTPEEGTQAESDMELDLNIDAVDAVDISMSTDADEVATKLDLAKAYIDMGDADGARGILDEVAQEGNDTQKQEAEELVKQLG